MVHLRVIDRKEKKGESLVIARNIQDRIDGRSRSREKRIDGDPYTTVGIPAAPVLHDDKLDRGNWLAKSSLSNPRHFKKIPSRRVDEVLSNVEDSDERKRKASQEKFVPFARFLLEKYNLDLFYLSLEFLFRFRRFWFLRSMLEFILGIFISFFLICFDIGIVFYKF